MPRLSKNTWCAIGTAAGTLIYLVEAWQLPFGSARYPDIGFMPVLMGFIVLGLCGLLAGREALRPPEPKKEVDLFDEEEEKGESTGLRKPLVLSAAILLYPLAFVHGGFIPATIALLTISLRLMEYRGWVGSFVIAAVVTLFANFFFGHWLHVNFPKGILG